MLHASFYLGTIGMVGALVPLLRRLFSTQPLQAFSLMIIGLFYGGGGYHGFFWVVPSFFSLLLFLVIFSLLIKPLKGHWQWLLVVLVPPFIFAHPGGIYLLAIYILYLFFYGWFTKYISWPLVRRTMLVVSIGVSCSIAASWYLRAEVLPYSLENARTTVHQTKSKAKTADATSAPISKLLRQTVADYTPGAQHLKNDYFNWLFPHWAGIFVFAFFLWLLVRFKRFELLALYSASIVFTLVAIISSEASRTLVVLWPVTFLVYAGGFWYGFIFFRDHFSLPRLAILAQLSLAALLVFFICINGVYSILYARTSQAAENIHLPTAWVEYLLTNTETDEPILYTDKILLAYSLNTELITRPLSNRGQLKYTVAYHDQDAPTPAKKEVDYFFALALNFFKDRKQPEVSHAPAQQPNSGTPKDEYSHLRLEYMADSIEIYRHPSYQR